MENRARKRPVVVVICDDDPDMLLLMRVQLAGNPQIHVAAEARDGNEVVQVVESSCPDVIVLDIAMPDMDGITALPRIKNACPATEVVFFTGFDRLIIPDIGSAYALVEKGRPLDELVGMVLSAAGKVA
jgi:CheY-like chemotaxis protein